MARMAPQAADTDQAPKGLWLILIITLAATFMQLLDTTITTVAVPSIQLSLHATFGEEQLILAGYSLAFACVLITGGRLGDRFGRRRLFLIGMTLFTLASAACGAAPTGVTLVVFRVVQGMCAGLMFPQVLAILQVTFPAGLRQKALGFYGATIGLASVLGPVLGGALIKLNLFGWDWRTIFLVNVPIGATALVAGLRRLPESTAPDAARLDLPGAATVTTGLFLLVLPLAIGQSENWPTWSLVMLAASVPVFIAFALYERALTRRPGSSPLLRTSLFQQRSFSAGLLLCLVFYFGLASFFFVFVLMLQDGFGYSAILAGVTVLPFAVMTAVGSGISTGIVRRLGKWTLLIGCLLSAAGMAGVVLTVHVAGTSLHGFELAPALIVGGAGLGLVLAPVTGVILGGIRPHDAGAASGALSTVGQVGSAAGIAIAGLIFFGQLGGNANVAEQAAVPVLHARLAAAGVPVADAGQVIAGFRTCFTAQAKSANTSVVPASCLRMPRAAVVSKTAIPVARRVDFMHSLERTALFWQVSVYVAAGLLVFALPATRRREDSVPEVAAPGAAAASS
jgi:EmrB/QacA subfamily drug resistance transporter